MGTSRTRTVFVAAAITIITAVAVFITTKTGNRGLALILAAVGVIIALVYILIANSGARNGGY